MPKIPNALRNSYLNDPYRQHTLAGGQVSSMSLAPTVNPQQLGIGLQRLSPMGSSTPSFAQPSVIQHGNHLGGDDALAAGGGTMNWLGEDDNWAKLLGGGLAAYSGWQNGRIADKQLEMQQAQIEEERKRHDEERARRSNAAKTVSPHIEAMMKQLQAQAAAQAGM